MADHLLGANPVAGKQHMSVQPFQVHRHIGRHLRHHPEADDDPRLRLFRIEPGFKGLGVVPMHPQFKVQPAFPAVRQSRQQNSSARRRQGQPVAFYPGSREQI